MTSASGRCAWAGARSADGAKKRFARRRAAREPEPSGADADTGCGVDNGASAPGHRARDAPGGVTMNRLRTKKAALLLLLALVGR